MSAVLFLADSNGIGVTYHLVRLACHMKALAGPAKVEPLLCVAGDCGEQFPGLWRAIRASFPVEDVFTFSVGENSLEGSLLRLLKDHEHVVVHIGGMRRLRQIIPLKRRFKRRLKVVFTVNSVRGGQRMGGVVSFATVVGLFNWVDFVHFLTPWSARRLPFSKALFSHGRAGCIPWGVDCPGDSVDGNADCGAADLLSSATSDLPPFRIVYPAYFHPAKGHDWLIRGLLPVLRRHPNVQLILPGDGPRWKHTSDTVKSNRIGGQVALPGKLDRSLMPSLLTSCNLGVVPTRYETFGHNYVEPMAAGLPVVGTRFGVGEWIIQDYVTGLGVNYGDLDALRSAVEFFAARPEEAAAIGVTALSLVKQHLNWPTIANAHFRVYSGLLRTGLDGREKAGEHDEGNRHENRGYSASAA